MFKNKTVYCLKYKQSTVLKIDSQLFKKSTVDCLKIKQYKMPNLNISININLDFNNCSKIKQYKIPVNKTKEKQDYLCILKDNLAYFTNFHLASYKM